MKTLIGHKDIVDQLQVRKVNNKWPQAIVFYGPEGIGKKVLAKNLAAEILCENKNACGICTSCHQVDNETHPDLFVLRPPEGKVLIPIDSVRKMAEWESLLPVVKRGKVVIVSEASGLTEEAQNALLKIIEEPLSQTCFFIVADNKNVLLPTIESRCFALRMKGLNEEQLREVAKQNNWNAPSVVDIHLAMGSALHLSLLINSNFSQFTIHCLDNLYSASIIDVIQLSQGMFEFYSGMTDGEEGGQKITENKFAIWILRLMKLILEDAARLAENQELCYFKADEFKKFSYLMRRTSRDHRLELSKELRAYELDLSLNLSALSVVESALRSFYEMRFVQYE